MAFFERNISDTTIIEGILAPGLGRRSFENLLYERYQYLIKEGTWKHKLTEEECSIIYSDTILTAIENIQSRNFEGRSSLKTYIYQIFSNKCVDQVRKNSTNKRQVNKGGSIDEYLFVLPDNSRNAIEKLIEQYDIQLLQRRILELGDKCQKMIKAWGEGITDSEIASELGYQSASVAKTSRLRCMDKLRALYKGETA